MITKEILDILEKARIDFDAQIAAKVGGGLTFWQRKVNLAWQGWESLLEYTMKKVAKSALKYKEEKPNIEFGLSSITEVMGNKGCLSFVLTIPILEEICN